MNYKELNSAFKKINNWYEKKSKVLTVKTRPFNTSIVFSNLINKVLYDNCKRLYVCCCNDKEQGKKRKREYYNILIGEQEKNHIGDKMCIRDRSRPVYLHLKGLKKLGVDIENGHGYINTKTEGLKGNRIYLDFPSVGATENLMMAAVMAEGVTIIAVSYTHLIN